MNETSNDSTNVKSRKPGMILGASLLSAVAASLCCLLPLAAVILGVSGFAASAVFVKWRPYLLAVTFALLGAAWYFTYRKPKAGCVGEGAACATTPVAKWNKLVLWMASAVVIAVAAFPLYGGILGRMLSPAPASAPSAPASRAADNPVQPGTSAAPTAPAPSGLATLQVKIPSMECSLCAGGIQATLQKQPGVVSAQISYDTKNAVVRYDPKKISPDQIIAAIDQTGYKAVAINQKEQP